MHARESTVVRSAVRPVLESIEKRLLLSSTVTVIAPTADAAGQISVTGGKGSDNLTLSVRNVGKESLLVLADRNKETVIARQSISSKPFKNYKLLLAGGAGNDTLINASNLRATLDGGDGNDQLVGSVIGDTFVWNGLGRDKFVGTGATSTVALAYPTVGNVSYDAADVSIVDWRITNTVSHVVAQSKSKTTVKVVSGTADLYNIGNVFVTGTAGNDRLAANDFTKSAKLLGGAGNDSLTGGSGSDLLDGGLGKDSMAGNGGRDTIIAQYADFAGKANTVQISGGGSIDTLWMDGQNLAAKPTAAGGTYLNSDFEIINGGDGNDKIDSTNAKSGVTVYGNGGNDTILGSAYSDDLNGNDGNDSLVGNAGKDAFAGGEGDDAVVADYADFDNGAINTFITGDAGNDTLWIDGQNADAPPSTSGNADYVNVDIETIYGGNGHDKIDSTGMSTSVTIYGRAGNDTILGGSGDDSLDGGAGDDSLRGNDGNDTLDGSIGDDTLVGSAGNDLLLDTGGGKLSDDRTADDQVIVQSTGPLTDEQLGRTGDLMVLQQKGSITLVGPSTSGFKLLGEWVSEKDASGNEIFRAVSPVVKIQTYFGNVPIPNVPAFPISIVTKADNITGSGVFSSFTLGGSTGIPLGLSNPDSPLGKLAGQFGISGSVPDLSFGIALGSDLSGLGFPLANGLPYFYANAQIGGSLSFGGATASFSVVNSALAFDPSDPSFFATVANPLPPGVGVLDNLKIGGSLHGYIPYTPAEMPTIFANKGYKAGDTLGYGNLYLTGRVNVADILKSPPVPVLLSGELVLGLNSSRNLPASLPKFSGTDIGSVLGAGGGFAGSLTQMLGATSADDIFVGVNGKVELGIKKAGFEFSVPLGNASFGLKSIAGVGTVGARGKITSNPFAGTPLKDFIKPPIDLTVTADAGFDTAGAFSLGFAYSDTTSVGIGTFSRSMAFTLDNTGFGASLSGGISVSDTILTVTGTAYVNASGSIRLTLVDSALSVSGTGSLTGGISFSQPFLGSTSIDVTALEFAFDNNGFSFDLPFFDPITVPW